MGCTLKLDVAAVRCTLKLDVAAVGGFEHCFDLARGERAVPHGDFIDKKRHATH